MVLLVFLCGTILQQMLFAEDYFEDAHPMLNINDVIFVISASGGTPVATLTYFNGVATTAVDVVNGNTISATDN